MNLSMIWADLGALLLAFFDAVGAAWHAMLGI